MALTVTSISIGGHPVTVTSMLDEKTVSAALQSSPFQKWLIHVSHAMLEDDVKSFDMNKIEIQGVDFFGKRVGFVKIEVDAYKNGVRLPGICFLRGSSVAVLVCLKSSSSGGSVMSKSTSVNSYYNHGDTSSLSSSISGHRGTRFSDDEYSNNSHSNYNKFAVLVEQTRVPVGCRSILELPAGMMDDDSGDFVSVAVRELEEECGIRVKSSDLYDLTRSAQLGSGDADEGIYPSSGGCDEDVRLFYYEKRIAAKELMKLEGRLTGLRDHGELIAVRLVPWDSLWKSTRDAKVLCALQLLNGLRARGLPLLKWVTPKQMSYAEPLVKLSDNSYMPQLGFGLYKVPPEKCEEVVLDAIRAGYRHFDCASIYGNEIEVGRALKKCGIPRNKLFIASKVWNDAQHKGRKGVRESFARTLSNLDCGYLDLYYIHWPVPGHHIATYKELEKLQLQGKIRSIGLSNYTPNEYQELVEAEMLIRPVVNQLEVSPVMYRPDLIEYFHSRDIVVVAFKALNRGELTSRNTIVDIAKVYNKTPAQIFVVSNCIDGPFHLPFNFLYSIFRITRSCKLEAMGHAKVSWSCL